MVLGVAMLFRILLLTVLVAVVEKNCFAIATDDDHIAANFVFGDSLFDCGNNNYIKSLSKANYPPNGIDFGFPTGRFTNNRTTIDIIGQELGFGFTPPYLAPTTKGPLILRGVSYASGGSGILNETGKIWVGRINMDAQLDNFANTRQDIISSIGAPAAQKLFQKAIFSVSMASNDLLGNYLLPNFLDPKPKLDRPELFVAKLISKYKLQLTRLYNLGARKVMVTSLAPIGCVPYEKKQNSSKGNSCATFPNKVAQLFNTELKKLLKELPTSLEGSTFAYANVYRIMEDIIRRYRSYGFENTDTPCCNAAAGGIIACAPYLNVCIDRSKHIFWDPFHPSDATNVIIAKRLIDGDSDDISPINFRQLSAL